jgi:hypothetical protein
MTQAHDTQPLNGPVLRTTTWEVVTEPQPDSPEPKKRRRRSVWSEMSRWLVTLVVFAVLAVAVLSGSLLAAIYWQARTDQLARVDAIVVLGAAQYDGRPSPVLRARLDEALIAYRAGAAPLVVVSGGGSRATATPRPKRAAITWSIRACPGPRFCLKMKGAPRSRAWTASRRFCVRAGWTTFCSSVTAFTSCGSRSWRIISV